MKRKIFKSIFFTGIAVAVVSVVIIMSGMYWYTTKEELGRLKTEAYIVADGMTLSFNAGYTAKEAAEDSENAVISYLAGLPYDNYRVTWISCEGDVLFDSDADAANMENHLEREEVAQALASGYGESVRYSKTIAHTELYVAVKIDSLAPEAPGTVLRMSCPRLGILLLLGGFAQPLCILMVAVIIISLLLANRLAKKIAGPINEIDPDRPEDYIGKEDYAEVFPLLRKMSLQQKQLAKDKAETEETARIRQEFTANVSHELKSPLHVISGYAEIIENGMAKAEDIKPFAGKIRKESVRLSELVDDIIELTELDSQQNAAEETKDNITNLKTLVANIAESLEPLASRQNIRVNIDTPDDCFVKGSPKHLYSIVYNLLDNAIKYNREGGEVSIAICHQKENEAGNVNGAENAADVILQICDTGIGIPEEHLSRVFERFYREDKSRSKNIGGTGLGLSIVKHAARLAGAEIKIDSKVGKGTTVTVTIPEYRAESC